jgi:hypothetical protein
MHIKQGGEMSFIRSGILLFVAIAILSACASEPSRRLADMEKIYDTDGPITSLYHAALYYPDQVALRYDGYIVGIEKSERDRINVNNDVPVKGITGVISKEDAKSRVDDFKLMFVSHIIRNGASPNSGNGATDAWSRELRAGASCAIYNAYAYDNAAQDKQFARPCDPQVNGTTLLPSAAFAQSWTALDKLGASLQKRLDGSDYTHVVVLVMGWNTVQEEAVRNFNSLAANLIAAHRFNADQAKDDNTFKPLFIGVTWPSQWNSKWADPIMKLFSFGVKASDADEVGLTWLGVLLHQTIPQNIKNQKLIVIGHSFGARATSVASCAGPVLFRAGDPVPIDKPIDTLVNLQGAYLIGRLIGGEKEKGFHYPQDCPAVKNLVLTASDHDKAVAAARWGSYVGLGATYKAQCNGGAPRVNCAVALPNGTISDLRKIAGSTITYVDASDLISENAYETGGGAHSDIYRREDGIFIRQAMELPSK